jgi:hypothetical protein
MNSQSSLFGDAPEPEIVKLKPVKVFGPLHNSADYQPFKTPGTVLTVRGTNGSGKSTLMRRVFEKLGSKEPRFIPGRSIPYYYLYEKAAVIGAYETMAGGCDTIPTVAEVYEIVKLIALSGKSVLFEGLLHSADIIHTEKLPFKVHIIYLSTPEDVCIDSVKRRRAEAGNEKVFDPKNLQSKYRCVRQSIKRALLLKNVEVFDLDREAAFVKSCELLSI